MYKSPLEEFLDLTELQTNPDYVSNLLKTAYSKNITIQDWNTFIDQFQALISRDAATYLGFKNVLKEIRLYQKYIDDTNNIFIRYSANSDGTDFTEEWSEGQNYIGFATGQTAPTDKSGYEWLPTPKGEQGVTPHIGENGNWWIGNEDTGVKAKGEDAFIQFKDDGNGNITIGAQQGDVTFTDDGDGNVILEVI